MLGWILGGLALTALFSNSPKERGDECRHCGRIVTEYSEYFDGRDIVIKYKCPHCGHVWYKRAR